MHESSSSAPVSRAQVVWLALALSLGAAVSLGITRFAYALLLPPMDKDSASARVGNGRAAAGAWGSVMAGRLCRAARQGRA